MQLSRIILALAVLTLVGGCSKDKAQSNSTDDTSKSLAALYRHLGVSRWARPLSSRHGYQQVQLVYSLEGKEQVLLSLWLGSNVHADGVLEVMIHEDAEKNVIVSLAFLENGSSFNTRKRLDKKFVRPPGAFDAGYKPEEWEKTTLLMAGGEAGSSSQIDDPINIEKVVLRFIGTEADDTP